MKKILLIALIAGLALTGCNKNGSGDGSYKLKITVADAADYTGVVTVKAIIFDSNTEEDVVIAQTAWNGGSFTITLPAEIDETLLSKFNIDEDWITISDTDTKGVAITGLYLYNAEDEMIGSLSYSYQYYDTDEETYSTSKDQELVFMFLDRKMAITGTHHEADEYEDYSYTYDYSYNCKGNKGWNMMYISYESNYTPTSYTATVSYTTTKPNDWKATWQVSIY